MHHSQLTDTMRPYAIVNLGKPASIHKDTSSYWQIDKLYSSQENNRKIT